MKLRAAFAALAVATTLGACATAPEPCTAAWIDYRTDQILSRFARENRGLISDLRQVARPDGKVDTVRAILLAAKAEDLQKFANSFNKVIVPELRTSLNQCRGNENFVPAFTEFLRKEGVSEPALEWVGPILAVAQVIEANQ